MTDTPLSDDVLLPCPFCQHTDELLVVPCGAADERWAEVYCDHCCARGPTAPTEVEAIAAWNTRVALGELAKLTWWGTVSLTSADGHCVRIDYPNRDEAEQMYALLSSIGASQP